MTALTLLSGFDPWLQAAIGLTALLIAAFIAQAVAQYLLLHTVPRLRGHVEGRWARVAWHDRVLRRAARIVPSVVVKLPITLLQPADPDRCPSAPNSMVGVVPSSTPTTASWPLL